MSPIDLPSFGFQLLGLNEKTWESLLLAYPRSQALALPPSLR